MMNVTRDPWTFLRATNRLPFVEGVTIGGYPADEFDVKGDQVEYVGLRPEDADYAAWVADTDRRDAAADKFDAEYDGCMCRRCYLHDDPANCLVEGDGLLMWDAAEGGWVPHPDA